DARLFQEPCFRLLGAEGLLGGVEPDRLEGELALDLWVAGEVNVAHRAATQRAQDDVPADLLRIQACAISARILSNVSRAAPPPGRGGPRALVPLGVGSGTPGRLASPPAR